MNKFGKTQLTRSEAQRGATMVEYALLVCLISLAGIASLTLAGDAINNTFNHFQTDHKVLDGSTDNGIEKGPKQN